MGKNRDYIEEYVQINGIKQYFLHYPSAGEEVVIFLHGGPGSPSSAIAYVFMEHFDFCNFVYYDQRGTGKTIKANKTKASDLTLDTMLADLKETIRYVKEKYQTDKVILLGQSWGSVLGTQYVLRYPEDVACYIGTGQVVNRRKETKISYDELEKTIKSAGSKKDLEKLQALGDGSDVDAADFDRYVVQFQKIQSKYGHSVNIREMLKFILKSPIIKISDWYYFVKGMKLNEDLSGSLSEYDILDIIDYAVPVYYILGRNDWQVPSTLAAEYFETIKAPYKGLFWIENAGHVADVDNPRDFSQAVQDIIRKAMR